MPDPTDKRAALIEALGRAICLSDLKERIAATVDAIVAIVDERVVGLRAPEAEGGGTTPSDCIKSPFVSRACERGTRGCNVRHDAPSEEKAAERRIAELELQLSGACRGEQDARRILTEAAGLPKDTPLPANAIREKVEALEKDRERLANAEKRIAELEAERDAAVTLLRRIRPADNGGGTEITYDGPSLRRAIDRALRGQMPETETDEC